MCAEDVHNSVRVDDDDDNVDNAMKTSAWVLSARRLQVADDEDGDQKAAIASAEGGSDRF